MKPSEKKYWYSNIKVDHKHFMPTLILKCLEFYLTLQMFSRVRIVVFYTGIKSKCVFPWVSVCHSFILNWKWSNVRFLTFVVSKTNIAMHHGEQHESVGKGECFYNMFVGKYLLPPAMGI